MPVAECWFVDVGHRELKMNRVIEPRLGDSGNRLMPLMDGIESAWKYRFDRWRRTKHCKVTTHESLPLDGCGHRVIGDAYSVSRWLPLMKIELLA